MATCNIKRIKPYRDDNHGNKHDHENDDNTYCYQAKGGSWVYIPELINPFSALNVGKNASLGECKRAFRRLVATPNRQKRMLVAYAWHMLTNEVLYAKGEKSLCDVFDYAISGDTLNLAQVYPALFIIFCQDIYFWFQKFFYIVWKMNSKALWIFAVIKYSWLVLI